MDRTGSVLDVLIPNLQQTPRTVVPYRYLMRKRGGEREQFLQKKLVLRTGVLSHPVYGWYGRARMDRMSSVLDVLTPNLQQTPKTDVPYRYLMRK